LKCGTKDDPGGAPGWGDAPATSGIQIKCMLIFLIMLYSLKLLFKKKPKGVSQRKLNTTKFIKREI
jgi:hypothetical protein